MIQIGPSAREETIGIVEKTDTATHAITAGQYVVWKGVGCVAASDISVGDTLSSSNLTAVSNGVANDIMSKIPPVSDSLSDTSTTNALSAAQGKALNDSLTTANTAIANAVNLSYPNVKVPATTSTINFNEHTVAEILKFEADSYVINSQNSPSIWAGTLCAVPLAQQNMTNNWGFGYQIYIDRKGGQFIRYIETDGNHNTTFGTWQQLALKSDISSISSRFVTWTGGTKQLAADGQTWLCGAQHIISASAGDASAALCIFSKTGSYYRLSPLVKSSDAAFVYNQNGVFGVQFNNSYNNSVMFGVRLV